MSMTSPENVIDTIRHAGPDADLRQLGATIAEHTTPSEYAAIIEGMLAKAAELHAHYTPDSAADILDNALFQAITRHPADYTTPEAIHHARTNGVLTPQVEEFQTRDARVLADAGPHATVTTDQAHVITALARVLDDGDLPTRANVSRAAHTLHAEHTHGSGTPFIDADRVDWWIAEQTRNPKPTRGALTAHDALTYARHYKTAADKHAVTQDITTRPTPDRPHLTVVSTPEAGKYCTNLIPTAAATASLGY